MDVIFFGLILNLVQVLSDLDFSRIMINLNIDILLFFLNLKVLFLVN